MVNPRVLALVLLVVCLTSTAQNRYMVYFTDKDNTPYTLSSPEDFLSGRSLDRRTHHQVALTNQDLPVDPGYLNGLQTAGAEVYFKSKWLNAALVTLDPGLVSTIESLGFVSMVELVGTGEILSDTKVEFTVPDSFDEDIIIVTTSENQNSMLGADELRIRGATGKGLLVAVFDGGFDGALENTPFAHLHEENKIVAELDYVANSGNPYQYSTHGTRVLSCIAGLYQDVFTGTAPGVDLILAVTEEVETEYPVEMYNWLIAAEYADSAGVDIISSSVGYVDFDTPFESWTYTFEDLDGETSVIAKAANWASERGILIVNSAGNSGGDGDVESSTFQSCVDNGGWCRINTPSDSPHVLSVGAVQADGKTRAYFSSYGPTSDGRIKPDVSAKGFQTSVANSTGLIIPNDGTSFSAPLIAGFAASLWEAYPDLTNSEMRELLRNSGSLASAPNNELGYGVPDFLEIVNFNGEPYLLKTETFKGVEVYPNPFSSTLRFNNLKSAELSYKLMNMEGKVLSSGMVGSTKPVLYMDASLQSGLYFIVVKSGDFSETIKLLKK